MQPWIYSNSYIIIIGLLWNNYYASLKYLQSYRGLYSIINHVNINEQIRFILIHPIHDLNLFLSLTDTYSYIFLNCFDFGSAEYACNSPLISTLLFLFIGSIILYYPIAEKINFKIRLGLLFTFLLIIYGTCLISYLTWTPVGLDYILGIQLIFHWIIPLLPLIFGINNKTKEKNEINKAIITITIVFIGLTIMKIVLAYY